MNPPGAPTAVLPDTLTPRHLGAPMTNDQFRQALQELHGDRDLAVYFGTAEHLVSQANPCMVKRAMLIPSEEDGLVKVTDGKAIYIIDAEKVAWIKIG